MVMGTSQACTKPGESGEGQVSDLDESVVLGTISFRLDLRWEQK